MCGGKSDVMMMVVMMALVVVVVVVVVVVWVVGCLWSATVILTMATMVLEDNRVGRPRGWEKG
jgi:hypothetical protein